MDKFVIKKPKLDDSVCLGKRKGTFYQQTLCSVGLYGKNVFDVVVGCRVTRVAWVPIIRYIYCYSLSVRSNFMSE
jgi:hypothetical protein